MDANEWTGAHLTLFSQDSQATAFQVTAARYNVTHTLCYTTDGLWADKTDCIDNMSRRPKNVTSGCLTERANTRHGAILSHSSLVFHCISPDDPVVTTSNVCGSAKLKFSSKKICGISSRDGDCGFLGSFCSCPRLLPPNASALLSCAG